MWLHSHIVAWDPHQNLGVYFQDSSCSTSYLIEGPTPLLDVEREPVDALQSRVNEGRRVKSTLGVLFRASRVRVRLFKVDNEII